MTDSTDATADDRYSRQILFPSIGAEGQRRLGAATVGLVGLGALGSTLAEQLVRAGLGRLVAVDRDFIEPSNLHRQGLYTDADARRRLPKAVAARQRLAAANPDVVIDARVADLDADSALEMFRDCDLLLDGTDSFETRYLINDLALELDVPWIYGACVAAQGMTATIIPGTTRCLACLFPEPPPAGSAETCDTAGIIAPAAQIVASLQITEALKILVDDRDALRPSLLSFELWPFRLIEIGGKDGAPRADCFACGRGERRFLRGTGRPTGTSLCGRNAVQIVPARATSTSTSRTRIWLPDLARRLESVGPVRINDYLLTVEVDGLEMTVFDDGRALIKGTTDLARARSVYARYVGA